MQHRCRSILLRAAAGVLLAAFISGCGGGGGSNTAMTRALVGPAGGTLMSADGRFTLAIPAGALTGDTTITVTELAADTVPADLRASNPAAVYRLEPAGTTFAVAPTVTLRLPASAAGTLSVMLLESGGVLEAPAELRYTDTAEGPVLTGRIAHFSHLMRWTMDGFTALLDGVPPRVAVGQPVTATFTLVKDAFMQGSGILHNASQFIASGPVVQESVEEVEGSVRGFTTGFHGMYRAILHGRCQSAGQGSVVYEGLMTGIHYTPWEALRNPSDVEFRIHVEAPVECVQDTSDSGGTPIAIGLFPAPAGLTGLDELRVFRGPFANLPGNGPFATLAGAEGFKVIDLATRQTVLDRSGEGGGFGAPLIGALPVASAAASGAPAALLGFGNGGTGTQGWTQANGFGLVARGTQPVFDVATVGGGLVAGTVFVILPSLGIDVLAYDAQTQAFRFDAARQLSLSAFPFAGQLMSAQKTSATRPGLLVLSRATSGSSTLSSVYFKRDDDPPQPATRIYFTEGDARRLRCRPVGSGDACAITMFNGLTKLFLFDPTAPTAQRIPLSLAVGSGALGVDITTRDNGNLLFAVTNFTGNSYNLIETRDDLATVVSNSLVPVPAGCTSPAHPAFVRDSQGLKVVITCHGSGNYFVASTATQSPP